MLTVNHHSVAYGQSTIIRDLDLSVAENEIVAVVGRNGMGKTTLMKSLIGMTPTRGGSVQLGDANLTPMKSFQRVRAGLGFVPQGRMIFPTLTVRENIETGLAAVGEKKVPQDLYELFPVLEEMQHRRGGNLSGGQQQQLAIARALATRPRVLLLDEPTEGIQPSIIQEMARTLKRIRDERGLSIVVSEQVLSFVMDIADRILVIEKGDIVHEEAGEGADQEKIAGYLSV
ncbi:urea ABC transporter ATP-binding subunit UrtE [Alloalcanivorax sp. C16-2]|uniref:urea ABC transporter ATP-binding subunit UrtE n=1 Tax=Alloalcanivorax TaxID=3020832 RepID=UPI001932ED38|nr:urea ABC transporter ATP-binding subunit UrtE [Alloalcanivorax marinus]MBL7250302.1 urea ABC transporter ATP-binding subunit UrtE [Alloalcanivorax marinus]